MAQPIRAHERAAVRGTPEPELVRVAGAHRDMGRAQGRALGAKVRDAERALRSAEAFRLLKPRLLPEAIFAAVASRRAQALLERPVARHRPEQLERMLGLAEGAGVPPRTVYLVQGAEVLLATVDWRVRPPPLAACAAVAVTGSRARGGPLIHHNFDYPELVLPLLVVRESRPARGHASLELTAAALAGAVDGVNEKGLAIAYDYGSPTDSSTEPVPLTLTLSAALETCATTQEAIDFLSKQPRSGGALLQIADASGDVAALELSSTRAVARRPAPGEELLHHANCYSVPALREVEVPRDAVYSERSVRALRGERVHLSSEARDARLGELLSARRGPLGLDDLREIFSDHGGAAEGSDLTLCRHGPYWSTVAMIQLAPRERRLRVALGPACSAEPIEFGL
jgi:isopenicillin-N N-acyltransferase-like protein